MTRSRRPPSRIDRTPRAIGRRLDPGRPARAGPFGGLLRRVLGLRRRIEVNGVRYRETQAVPIDRALSPRGKGVKRYEVRFPTGRAMPINATATRRYADLMDVPELRSIVLAERFFRPGSRVLILGCGTGGLADRISGWIGPHGGIVAIEHDNESVRFARRRYPLAHTSFERGGHDLLGGEIDGSFDAVVVVEAWLRQTGRHAEACIEAWRVTGPGGRLVLIGDNADQLLKGVPLSETEGTRATRLTPTDGGPVVVVLAKPGEAGRGDEGRN